VLQLSKYSGLTKSGFFEPTEFTKMSTLKGSITLSMNFQAAGA
jgi:hypothetical protein